MEKLLKYPLSKEEKFEALFLRANLFFSSKKIQKAIEEYEKLIKQNPHFAQKRGVYLQLSLAYESILQYSKAIKVLKDVSKQVKMKDIDERIERLRKRKKMMPEAF